MSDDGGEDFQLLAEAVSVANVPTLLMVLVQLTGEMHWMDPPYRPRRAHGVGDNDTGRLPESIQAEIRDAALAAIVEWRNGRPMAIPKPSPELLVQMLSCAMGEPIPLEYAPMMAMRNELEKVVAERIEGVPEGFQVLVIGAGVSGIAAGVNLQATGIPFTILERSETVGGVWFENHYPGAGVDTPNHLYSYTFAPHDWSMFFCLRDELRDYLESVTDRFGLRSAIRFGTEVEAAAYDAEAQEWAVDVRRGDGLRETLRANVVISAAGIFNPMKLPNIKGRETFSGPCMHTAQWRDDVDLVGKRVAVIGNGASAMQLCPAIQDTVASLTIFQKSAHWAAPFEQFHRRVPDALRYMLTEVPLYRSWYRTRLGWMWNDRIFDSLHKDPSWPHPERSLNATNDAHRQFFTEYVVSELGDRTDLLDLVLPTYPPFGKRMLLDNGWYRMLRNERVHLVADPITEIRPNGVVTADGRECEVDVLVFATGFDVTRFLSSYEVRGRSGRTLREVWDDDDARAYMGAAVPDFPNFFILYGPNTQPGHGGSFMFTTELTIHLVIDILKRMVVEGIGSIEVRRDVHDRYNEAIDRANENMVWTHPGMDTYYRNSRGRVTVNYPLKNIEYFNKTREANLADFITEPRLRWHSGQALTSQPRVVIAGR